MPNPAAAVNASIVALESRGPFLPRVTDKRC
jgi:hypothetical protein